MSCLYSQNEEILGLNTVVGRFLHLRSELNSDKHHAIPIYLVLGCN
jgi:hypothetical protein